MPKFKMPYFSNSLGKLALIYHDQPVFAGLVQVAGMLSLFSHKITLPYLGPSNAFYMIFDCD